MGKGGERSSWVDPKLRAPVPFAFDRLPRFCPRFITAMGCRVFHFAPSSLLTILPVQHVTLAQVWVLQMTYSIVE